MKKLAFCTLMALAALGFSACELVSEPDLTSTEQSVDGGPSGGGDHPHEPGN